MSFKKDEKIGNVSKLRVDLRFYAELISVGVFTLKEGLPLLGQALTFIVNSDRETHSLTSLVLAFCKHCGDDFLGLVPRKIRIWAEMHNGVVPESNLLPAEKQKNVKQLFKEYYNSLCKHWLEEQREFYSAEKTNRRILLTKGEVIYSL